MRVLFSPRTRDKATYEAFNQFLDLVCYGKGKPKGGDVIKVKQGADLKQAAGVHVWRFSWSFLLKRFVVHLRT